MAHYAIGDLQGCYDELAALLATLGFNHGRDTLWLVGDIVNRGPQSLECLQFVMAHEGSVQIVLGNHDLHLLAVMYGDGRQKKNDTLSDILVHRDAAKMRDWLRHQPLMRQSGRHILAHAGLLPEWTVQAAEAYAEEVQYALMHAPQDYFAQMYGNAPRRWQDGLRGAERLRMITNVFTRMRTLDADGSLNFDYKGTYAGIPAGQHAWFDAPNRLHADCTVVFGHWSALGLHTDSNVCGLDTGCLWGGELTALNLDSGEIVQQVSLQRKKAF